MRNHVTFQSATISNGPSDSHLTRIGGIKPLIQGVVSPVQPTCVTGVIVPTYKKGNRSSHESHKGFSLVGSASKQVLDSSSTDNPLRANGMHVRIKSVSDSPGAVSIECVRCDSRWEMASLSRDHDFRPFWSERGIQRCLSLRHVLEKFISFPITMYE